MYVIIRTRQYSGPRTTRTLVAHINGTARKFNSRATAKCWIKASEVTRYDLSHGEIGRPTYKVWTANAKGVQGLVAA